jgi:branched-chain amino acid transport system permease protein
MSIIKGKKGFGLFGIVIFFFLIPHFLGTYWTHIMILTLFFIYLCSAWNIIGGIGGQFCFAHTLFLASGAYTSTKLYIDFGISPWLGMILGSMIATIIGLFIAWINFRYKLPHLSFALVTLGFVYIGMFVIGSIKALGGHDGLTIMIKETNILNYTFISKIPYYYIILFMTIGVIILIYIIERSKLGLYLKALRDNERAAEASGVDLLRVMCKGMALSAFLTALAGTFYAQMLGFIDPVTVAGPHLIIEMILFTAIGGFGTLWGPVIGPMILVPLGQAFLNMMGTKYAGLDLIIYGVIVVIVILFMPQGIVGWVSKFHNIRGKRNGNNKMATS